MSVRLLAAGLAGLVIATVGPAGAASPRAPGTIAFSANNQIYTVRDGRTSQLTHDRTGVVGISWSPDGSRLLAWRYRRVPSISIVNADGSIGPQVARNVGSDPPRWSPNGRSVAYEGFDNYRSHAIYVARADGSSTRRVANDAATADRGGSVTWSPDGTRLAYVGKTNGHYAILVVRVNGASTAPVPILRLEPGASPVRNLAWSPDGSTIAFESFGIALINADGTGLRKLPVPAEAYGPVWSPDGSKLALAGRNLNYVIDADGTGLERLPGRVCKHTWPGFAQHLSWSPDGSMIAYSGGTGPADCTPTSGIYVEKLDGSPGVRVAFSPAQYSRPLWRPTS